MFVCVLLLLFFASSLSVAARCDNAYVTNTLWLRRVINTDSETSISYTGCKKGCYWNNKTDFYNEFGALKCLKCSEIEDEFNCTSNIATCQWKKGKCISQSCPGIAKAHVSLTNTASTQWAENNSAFSVRVANYTQAVKWAKECVEGSALEKIFNQAYLDDYKNYSNYQFKGGNGYFPTDSPFYEYITSCTGTNIDNCDPSTTSCRYPNGSKCDSFRCGPNGTLSLFTSSTLCVDRITKIGGVRDTSCRIIPEFARQLCIYQETSEQSVRSIYTDNTNSVCRPGTKLERCIQGGNRERDTTHPCIEVDGTPTTCSDAQGGTSFPLMDDAKRLNKYGYGTVAEICENDLQQRIGLCEEKYKQAIGDSGSGYVYSGKYSDYLSQGCYSGIITAINVVNPTTKEHNRLVSKGQRGACHQIYGCMYSKLNGRCSYWAVWAFVLVLVLSIVCVCAVLVVVVVVVVVPKISGKNRVGAVSDGEVKSASESSSGSDTSPLAGAGQGTGSVDEITSS